MPPPRQRSPEWIEARKSGIGGSDIAVLAGLSPWSSPYQVYLEKRGEVEPEPESDAMERGNLLEEPVAQWWAKRTGRKVRRRHAILQHPDIPWARASIDRELVGAREVLEVKTTAQHWDEPPEEVVAQVQWQLGVGGYSRAHVAALTGGLQLLRWEILPDASYFADLVTIGQAAWDGILSGQPPSMDGSEATARALARVYRGPLAVDREPLLAADEVLTTLARELAAADGIAREVDAQRDTVRNAIRAALGEAAGVEGPGFKITWTRNRDSEKVDWEAVARDVGLADPAGFLDTVKRHTTTVEGARVLRAKFDETLLAPTPLRIVGAPEALEAGDEIVDNFAR